MLLSNGTARTLVLGLAIAFAAFALKLGFATAVVHADEPPLQTLEAPLDDIALAVPEISDAPVSDAGEGPAAMPAVDTVLEPAVGPPATLLSDASGLVQEQPTLVLEALTSGVPGPGVGLPRTTSDGVPPVGAPPHVGGQPAAAPAAAPLADFDDAAATATDGVQRTAIDTRSRSGVGAPERRPEPVSESSPAGVVEPGGIGLRWTLAADSGAGGQSPDRAPFAWLALLLFLPSLAILAAWTASQATFRSWQPIPLGPPG